MVLASILADAVVLLHLSFIVFVVAGAALLWRWPRVAWWHVPAVLWGALAELSGTVCPLTPLENRLRAMAGQPGYAEGFVEHYLLPLIYPQALTREMQIALGSALVLLNVLLYGLWMRSRKARGAGSGSA
jgi:hypothetical protein